MPRSTLLTAFMVCVSCGAMSQSSVGVGVKGGVNTSFISAKNIPPGQPYQTTTLVGFQIGVFGEFKFNDKLALHPELQFIQRGYTEVRPSPALKLNKIKINYLEFPVLLSYFPSKSFKLEAGPVMAVKLSVSQEPGNPSAVYDIENVINRNFEAGVAGGMRFKISKKLTANYRYYYGLTSVEVLHNVQGNSGTPESSRTHSQSMQVSVGYMIVQGDVLK